MLLKTIKSKKSLQNKGCRGLRNLPCPEIKAVGQQPALDFSLWVQSANRVHTPPVLILNWAFFAFLLLRESNAGLLLRFHPTHLIPESLLYR